MAWFLNYYSCERCHRRWSNDWSCMCDDDCPHCGARHHSPVKSEDLSELIVSEENEFVVLFSPDTAEHEPNYKEIGRFPTHERAEAFLAEFDPEQLAVTG